MRKVMTVLSVVFGVLTFAAIAYAGQEGSDFNVAFASVPALFCIMTAIAGDRVDEQHLDIDDADFF